jgi:hypothetical protein
MAAMRLLLPDFDPIAYSAACFDGLLKIAYYVLKIWPNAE